MPLTDYTLNWIIRSLEWNGDQQHLAHLLDKQIEENGKWIPTEYTKLNDGDVFYTRPVTEFPCTKGKIPQSQHDAILSLEKDGRKVYQLRNP